MNQQEIITVTNNLHLLSLSMLMRSKIKLNAKSVEDGWTMWRPVIINSIQIEDGSGRLYNVWDQDGKQYFVDLSKPVVQPMITIS